MIVLEKENVSYVEKKGIVFKCFDSVHKQRILSRKWCGVNKCVS
jgi:hypothetical protein